ncbi:hypothetical protein QTP70_007892 [Hemibagrus guttatus]|uniref:Uncharacterized protein n=1 Tax=Hemibagrus guttatus TaxID=175788 RepID=A0AAE0V2I9_9TELE|nr:hypothetical protein QTP70_007892 [Hemibagrus guttatus]KAK3560379.1 hypothetical protein QTP86_006463 [Hemibagrus guttatus]
MQWLFSVSVALLWNYAPPSLAPYPNVGTLAFLAGANPPRPGTFPGASSPGPVADLYGPTSQDSGVGNYISAASPQPGSGFGHSIAVQGSGSVFPHPQENANPGNKQTEELLNNPAMWKGISSFPNPVFSTTIEPGA